MKRVYYIAYIFALLIAAAFWLSVLSAGISFANSGEHMTLFERIFCVIAGLQFICLAFSFSYPHGTPMHAFWQGVFWALAFIKANWMRENKMFGWVIFTIYGGVTALFAAVEFIVFLHPK